VRALARSGVDAPADGDTCGNISFGVNDLRVINALAFGKIFKPLDSAACR